MVTMQVTPTLRSMNQWNLYFSFLMVLTEGESVNLPFSPIQDGRSGEMQKDSFPSASFQQHF